MNSVHELGPNGDSEPIPSRKTRLKPSQVHEHQNWPSWHTQVRTGEPRRAHAWPCRGRCGLVVGAAALSWPWPPAVSQVLMAVSWPSAARRAPCRSSPAHCIARYSPVGQPSQVTIHYCVSRHKTSVKLASACHDTLIVS